MNLAAIQQRYLRLGIGDLPPAAFDRAAEEAGFRREPTTERGLRNTAESRLRALYAEMYADPELTSAIQEVRAMDRRDGRVKKIHQRTARSLTNGGLRLDNPRGSRRLDREWKAFVDRVGLDNAAKLESDARAAMMEGNLPLQWVLNDPCTQVLQGVRMPTETLRPVVGENGQFRDPARAWEQWDTLKGRVRTTFALWQLTVGRLSPDNWDDHGSMGRPYLDACREIWKKMVMTEEDLVIRRRERAPMRTAHFLEGATQDELEDYRQRIERDQQHIATNFYSNRKGSVTAIQGDAALDQIADVALLLDAFYAGSPAPKGLFGYTGDLNRDILDDLKRDFFEELDALQDMVSWVYEQGFRLQLLVQGLNPAAFSFRIRFCERLTETLNQRADRALKLKALGASQQTVIETAGLDYQAEREKKEDEDDLFDPYPSGAGVGVTLRPRVSVTEGNGPKGESATDVAA